jgi:DNA-binding response OmpR family regulator
VLARRSDQYNDGWVRTLIVEDEEALAQSIASGLTAEGHEPVLAHDGNTGYNLALTGGFDVIVLDIMLPGRNGFRVCRDLRGQGVRTPILMLTAKDGELDEAEALDTGADDFLRKPFSFVVLLARLRALQRRGVGAEMEGNEARLRCGDLVVDLGQRRCWRGDADVVLTSRELDVLCALMRRSPDVMPKSELIDVVWGSGFEGDQNVAEVYVGYLRRKIDTPFNRKSLQTLRGIGYRLDADG